MKLFVILHFFLVFFKVTSYSVHNKLGGSMNNRSLNAIAKEVFFHFLAEELRVHAEDQIEGAKMTADYARNISSVYLRGSFKKEGLDSLLDDYDLNIDPYLSTTFIEAIEHQIDKIWLGHLTFDDLFTKNPDIVYLLVFHILKEPLSNLSTEKLKNELLNSFKVSLPSIRVKYDYQPVWDLINRLADTLIKSRYKDLKIQAA
jgi:hypothetical protein